MSVTGAIVTAVLAEISTAISGITTLEGLLPIHQIPTDDFPHAQAFGEAVNVLETLPWRVELQGHAFTIVITDKGKTKEQMFTHYESIITQFDTNRDLGNTVHWIRVPSFAIDENADDNADLKTVAFEVVAEVYR